jgi:hypothetical protein
MRKIRTSTAAVAAAALVAAPLGMVAGPAYADGPSKKREFRVGGAEVDFTVEKDDGRFEVEVDIDDAKPGSKYRVVLTQDGKRFHKKVHRADSDGDIEIEKNRKNTKGRDKFKVKVKKIGGGSKVRTITMR